MQLNTMKLITIVANRNLKGELIGFLKDSGVSGYTSYNSYGKGASQLNEKGQDEIETVQIKVLTSPMLSNSIMKAIAQTYFDQHKIIIFEQDAQVIRPEKFDKIEY